MELLDIGNLTQTYLTYQGDYIHVLRDNEYKSTMSYKSEENKLLKFFESTDSAIELQNRIEAVKNKLYSLSAKFATKEAVEGTYMLKDKMNLDIPGFLTQEKMESVVSKYTTKYKLANYSAQARQEANRLADEASDFAAAAMVGINQMGGGEGDVSAAGGDSGDIDQQSLDDWNNDPLNQP